MTDTQSTVARNDSGEVQLTLSVSIKSIEEEIDKILLKQQENAVISGFRKGKAPISKVRETIPEDKLLSEAMSRLLPEIYANSVKEHNIKPAIYPRFELLSKNESDYSVRAITCEIPEFELPDWKEKLRSEAKVNELWVPGKEKDKKEPTQEEKEQKAVGILLTLTTGSDNKKIADLVPDFLVVQETNSRLSQLLERTEKLGLTLESYLASIGRSAEDLRAEYANQARSEIALDLILTKIALTEKIDVTDDEINKVLASIEQNNTSDEQKGMVRATMRKRKALEFAASLV